VPVVVTVEVVEWSVNCVYSVGFVLGVDVNDSRPLK
jgi:hypothetical protein